ncbi:MAG: hypothetical protein M8357_01380 [Desulfobulbaceae bacterium]|nr:hypothetical protein [Desulfobulbaceae bacterium]
MTIESLRKIISLEEELYAAEQAEQERAGLRLKEQQEEILRRHGEELAALAEKKTRAAKQAAEEAGQKAAAIVQEAKARAKAMDRLDDAALRHHLATVLKYIAGQAP